MTDSAIDRVERACYSYKDGSMSIDEFKALLWSLADELPSSSSRLRDFIRQAEAKIDSLQFTSDAEKVHPNTCQVADELVAWLSAQRSQSAL
jgi:hypothetical protein